MLNLSIKEISIFDWDSQEMYEIVFGITGILNLTIFFVTYGIVFEIMGILTFVKFEFHNYMKKKTITCNLIKTIYNL